MSEDFETYRMLIMRALEANDADIERLKEQVARGTSDCVAMRDRIRELEAQQLSVVQRVTTVESGAVTLSTEIGRAFEKIKKAETRPYTKNPPQPPSVFSEIWAHPAGKGICLMLALAAVLAAGAAFNAVSVKQVDLDRHLPKAEDSLHP